MVPIVSLREESGGGEQEHSGVWGPAQGLRRGPPQQCLSVVHPPTRTGIKSFHIKKVEKKTF